MQFVGGIPREKVERRTFLHLTVRKRCGIRQLQHAGMVELVDAADSKSADGNILRVQVSLPVPE